MNITRQQLSEWVLMAKAIFLGVGLVLFSDKESGSPRDALTAESVER